MDDVGVRGRKPDVSLSGGDGLVTEHRRIGLILRVKGEAAAGGFVCSAGVDGCLLRRVGVA